ncbi:hypothetical protein ABT127_04395 [Streptomyces sp. NPDC001904]|uniref:hypothetical protein n=1 Tax=Streptomyces sp. NPDC001904 TaxID=3154531 RepID=UPI00332D5379
MSGPLCVALVVWPVASALLLTIRWAGRTLYRWFIRHNATSSTTTITTANYPERRPDDTRTPHRPPLLRRRCRTRSVALHLGITASPWLTVAGLYVAAFLAWCAAR